MKTDRSNKAGSRKEKKQPIQTRILLLLFHELKDLCKNRRIESRTQSENRLISFRNINFVRRSDVLPAILKKSDNKKR
jgi:hypothetical protein